MAYIIGCFQASINVELFFSGSRFQVDLSFFLDGLQGLSELARSELKC